MGIQEELAEIKSLVQEKNKPRRKKFRLPIGTKVSKSQAKKNYITIMKINENGNVNFKKTQIDEQTIMEEGIPRLAAADYVLRYKNNPLIILPSWSVKPYSPAEQYEKSLNDGSNTKGYKILMAKMLKEQVNPKKQIGGMIKWVIGLAIAALIGYALITGGA